ncbi:MAG: L,D-transpeptidase [Chloroflexi bacterium]|nr:L,D-transpeptidase [Chloroflexota bacterium]
MVHKFVVISLFLILLITILPAPQTLVYGGDSVSPWEEYDIGAKAYAEVIEPPDALYRQLEPDHSPDQWIREPNTLLFGKAINVSERHRFLDREHVIRVTVNEGGWGIIEPDGRHSPYLPNPTDFQRVYVELKYLIPLPDHAFNPINVYDNTVPVDKLVVIVRDASPRLLLYEGEHLVLHVPVVLGPSKPGDYRVYRTRVSDDMPGIPAVPFSNYFSGGFTIHGAPWWNWHETVRGHYGSHGCVNLPDDEWYQIHLDGEYINVAQWVYRWMSTNIDYDETNPEVQEARVDSSDPGWYQATSSVRVIITESVDALRGFPLPERLGPLAATSKINDWEPLIEAFEELDGEWMLMHQDEGTDEYFAQTLPSDQSIAQIDGTTESDQWVLLDCEDKSIRPNMAYPGSSRTVGEVCDHLRVERLNSICTPERVDIEYFGERVLCNAARFNLLHIEERGELIEHEKVHMHQFSGYFRELHLNGIEIDDPTPFAYNFDQYSTIGITELMAQRRNSGSLYAQDYVFVLTRPRVSGVPYPINYKATTEEAWDHLRRECGDPTLDNEEHERILEQGLMGDAGAYQFLEEICSLPPHRLVPDRWRLPEPEDEDETAGES